MDHNFFKVNEDNWYSIKAWFWYTDDLPVATVAGSLAAVQ